MTEVVLEDSGYLAAPQGQASLSIPDAKKQANFELGVSMAVYRWDTLTTAVDNQWGGPDSAGKRDWITGLIVDAFAENKEIDIIYIHEMLFNAMEDEFGVIVEDESTVVVGQQVVQLYKECLAGEFEHVQKLYANWKQKQASHQKKEVHVQEDQLNPDASDSDEEEEVPQLVGEADAMDVDEPPAKKEPEVDDDGFTVVHRRRH